jgi:hypothetical protein
MLDASGTQHLLLAETLGLAMARRATDILDRHRAALTGGGAGAGGAATQDDDDQFAFDNAIFTAVLDAANECLGRFDARPADDRWCDALLQVINLAQLAELTLLFSGGTTVSPRRPSLPRAGQASRPVEPQAPGLVPRRLGEVADDCAVRAERGSPPPTGDLGP